MKVEQILREREREQFDGTKAKNIDAKHTGNVIEHLINDEKHICRTW